MKILSPVGNFESLKMAVINGADEVYLGINEFNARNNINSFDLSALEDAVNFAHLFNVKVLLAINILFNNSEMQTALNTVVDSYNLGVDAFIVQDLGLANLIHTNYPQIELHASTQMGIHNLEGVKAIEKFGFNRVVLARETPLDEIKRIKQNSNVEIEYFCQGALCVSFSGNCYLSSYLHSASGNRGRCKQLCRLPYTLKYNNKILKAGYLLSAKDFNLINRLKDLKDADVDVLKIEGRARRPYYVAMATREYANALKNIKPNQNNLKLAFNRDYTEGYFNGNNNIISNYNNHTGIFVGRVEKFNQGKRFNEVYFTSNQPLNAKSTFKFFNNLKEVATISAFDLQPLKNGKYKLTTTQKVNVGDSVNLIIDFNHEANTLAQTIKKDINVNIYAQQNKPLKAIITANNQTFNVLGDVLECANKQPLSKEEIVLNFTKSELFNSNTQIEVLENVFLPKQKLNEFRRKVFETTYLYLTNKHKHNLSKTQISNNYQIIKLNNFQIIENLNENITNHNVIYSPEEYSLENVKKFILKSKAENFNPILDTPNFALKKDIELLNNIIEKTKITIVANNYYALNFNTNIIIGAGLNVYNNYTASIFNLPVITAESNISSKIDFAYMTLRHCPFKEHLNAKCSNCPYKQGYKLVMESGKVLNIKRKKLTTCTFYLTK